MLCFGFYCKGIELGMSILNFTDKRHLLTNYYTLTSKIKCGLIFWRNLIGALI